MKFISCQLLPDSPAVELHGVFLRERCTCSKCVEVNSKQPHQPTTMLSPAATSVKSSEITEQTLEIVFEDDHKTSLCLTRLRREMQQYASTGATMASAEHYVPKQRYWSAKTFEMKKFAYENFELDAFKPSKSNFKHRFEMIDALLTNGVVVVENVPAFAGELSRFARSMFGWVRDTNWGETFDVKSCALAADPRGVADLAFTSEAIGFHCDNPYRVPAIDFQLLHCVRWNKLDKEGKSDGGVNQFVDAFYCAELLRKQDPAAFELLSSVPVKWENDAEFISMAPMIELWPDGSIRRVYYSSKSGGFAPPLDMKTLDAFFDAQRKFSALLMSAEHIVEHQLSVGELVMFANCRVLHSRTEFVATGERFLQGLYVDEDAVVQSLQHARIGMKHGAKQDTIGWTKLTEASKADIQLVTDKYNEDQANNRLSRVIGMLTAQRGVDFELGAGVDLFEHGLQTATRAQQAGESVDLVVAGLLHDVGELFSPSNHGDIAAALLEPYVEPAVHWCLAHHEIFQMKYYGEQAGIDPDVRDRFREHDYYALTERFCERYDMPSFDPNFRSLPLSAFLPLVREVLSRKPYWHTPDHPKRSAVTGNQ